MIDCDYKDKIISYIENELNNLEKAEFEIELQKNSELKEEYLEIKGLLNSLSSLPKLETSSDFMVSLNNRIDAHKKYSISSTPTIFINEKEYKGEHEYQSFKKAIKKFL